MEDPKEIAKEALFAAAIATMLHFTLPGDRRMRGRVFATNATGCYIYNEWIRTYNRPKSLGDKVIRGISYGAFAEAMNYAVPAVDSVRLFYAESVAASGVGNVVGPQTRSLLNYKRKRDE
jgi:hypothetical protein